MQIFLTGLLLLLIALPLRAQNPSDFLLELKHRAESGDPDAQFRLGEMYLSIVSEQSAYAAKWFRKSAQQGNAYAQLNIGIMHIAGNGVPKDPKEAIKWLTVAAEQGLPEASFYLADQYSYGLATVSLNPEKAAEWYKKAAQQFMARESCRNPGCLSELNVLMKSKIRTEDTGFLLSTKTLSTTQRNCVFEREKSKAKVEISVKDGSPCPATIP